MPEAEAPYSGRAWAPDLLGLIWVLSAGMLALIPALLHGALLGPYDLLSRYGLSAKPHSIVHNDVIGDQIMMFIPWTHLVWTQVHHGQLPLWNPYSVLGSPLAFNWVSAPFSVPVAIGYLFPVHLAYTVQIVVTVLIAGTGVYVLARVLRLSPLGSAMAATTFELSGPFIGWLGWPNSSVMSWLGWILAATALILRGRRRARNIAFFAVVLAFATYSGDPDELLVAVVLASVVFAVMTLLQRTPAFNGSGSLLRPVVDFAAATVAGLALAAPLILPGLQLASKANRTVVGPSNGPQTLPINDAVHLIFQGFDGLPLIHNQWFGYSNYVETAMYVGVMPLVLAVTAVTVHWKRPEVRSLSILAVVMALLVFVPPLVSLLDNVLLGTYWLFAMQPMILAIAVLSGMGMDTLIRSHQDQRVRKLLGIGFGVTGLILVLVWLIAERGLPPRSASIRAHSFIWPVIEVVVGLAVVWGLVKLPERPRPGRSCSAISPGSIAGIVLLACEAAFLVSAGAPIMSSSGSYLTTTPAEAQLERAVGSSLVGFGASSCLPVLPGVGILENVNVVFRIREFAEYDPMIPLAYYLGWKSPGYANASVFCPAITSATLARRFGISYVLEPPGQPGPIGGVFYEDVGNEELYQIPGSALATVVSTQVGSPFPAVDTAGTPVPISNLDSSSWKIVVDTTRPQVLRLRLTDVPGWHASIDGHPLQLHPFDRIMLQARVPGGRHVIELRYWPTTFSLGLVLAAISVVALSLMLVAGTIRDTPRRRRLLRRAPVSMTKR